MSRKKIEHTQVKKATLICPKEQFKQLLEERIALGKGLFKIDVSVDSHKHPTFGYGLYESSFVPIYDEQEFKAFTAEFRKWSDFNNELLKQSFDIPDNEYLDTYSKRGVSHVMTGDEDLLKVYQDEISEKISYLESLMQQLPLLPSSVVQKSVTAIKATSIHSNKVFIVHGHDKLARTEAELMLEQLGFEPVVLFKQANMGATVIEKLERESKDVCFAIALYTKCDEGKAFGESDLKPRARQNVVFEHGMMYALLGKDRVVALVDDGVEVPGDLSGVVYIQHDAAGNWKYEIVREMRAVGLDADANRIV